ncbi:unnamed protein product [Schistosoma curassoni]|uniref:Ovule protein n=1 Tax=Schistosoma curassoni TaxID=6186 RepID=A0A183KHL3_9TREM|nr:unnamed protein product [Schistosoma curassoni]
MNIRNVYHNTLLYNYIYTIHMYLYIVHHFDIMMTVFLQTRNIHPRQCHNNYNVILPILLNIHNDNH